MKKQHAETKKNITFWTLQMGTFDKYINKIISDYEAKNPDIHITWVDVPYSEGEKRTLASMLSNTPPDLVNLTPEFSILLAQKNALYKIPKDVMSEYVPTISKQLNYEGEYFGIPFYATSALTFYNKELLDKAGITRVPATYDEMNKDAQIIKDNTGAFVTMPALTENDTFLKILNKYNINSPGSVNSAKSLMIFNDYKNLYQNNLIPKESITQSHREALEKYMAGQIVILPAGANFLNIVKENAPKIFENTRVAPQLVGDSRQYDFSLMNFIVPQKAKYPNEAIDFAKYLTNEQNQLELAKLTTILPVNKKTLQNKYFTTDSESDIFAKARFISSNQLNNIQPPVPHTKNQKELLTLINNYIQQILLAKRPTQDLLDELSAKWQKL
ncbi:MAG: extracellular solute-binding protein [Candidatus Gastranaerophilales bacterium]|nr:extracellular solute-binding protein [Candidatus Gastranaerophilales bacterium]